MKIDPSMLHRIVLESRCDWTRGYVTGILDSCKPPREEIAESIIVTNGPKEKISAIKGLRTEFGLGLKEAKYMVDEFYDSGKIIFPA